MASIAALFFAGCGGGSSLPGTAATPVSESAPHAARLAKVPTSKAAPANSTAEARPASKTSEVEQTDASPDGHVAVRTDAKGRKWLGDVPYDVFFDDPLAVAAEGRTVASAAASAAGSSQPHSAGETPTSQSTAARDAPQPSPAATEKRKTEKPKTGSAQDWNELVESDELDAEVKRIRNELAAQLQSVAKYNSHYQEIAIAGSTLAAVAEIVAERAGSLSWKNNAPVVRDLGMQIHDAAKASGGPAFQATKTPYEQVIDALDGNVPAGVAPAQPQRDFAEVASRDAVMKRMDRSFQWLKKSGPAQQLLKKQAGNALHESTLLAALGRVIAVGHYDSADDPKYKAHAAELTKSAAAVAAAVKSDDAAAFTDAVGRVQKRCDACHADFRFQ